MRAPPAPLAILALLVASCGIPGGSTPPTARTISWLDNASVLQRNGAVPAMSAKAICGSDTKAFISELTTTPITQAKVMQEWADIIPGGRQLAISGIVQTNHLGPTDLPMTHESGDDLSMNVLLDSIFRPYSRQLGTAAGDEPSGTFHVEIASGYIPHVVRKPSPATGQTWAQMADFNLKGFQPGFDRPAIGDRALVQGRYIIDCGHTNYGTELHAISFLAWSHVSGNTTTVHAYYNPFRDTGYYNPDLSILGDTGDTTRMKDPATKPFPPYLVDEVLRLLAGDTPYLRSYGLIDAEQVSPKDWTVCAPVGTSGHRLEYDYDFVTRSGVTITATPDVTTGCVRMHTVIGAGYTPANLDVRQCVLPWAYLDKIAAGALGDKNIDIKKLIVDQVGSQNASKFDANPRAGCIDAVAGPTIDPNPGGTTVTVDDDQPIPFYGVVTVSWKP